MGGADPAGSGEVAHLLPEDTAVQAEGFSAPLSACPRKKPPPLPPHLAPRTGGQTQPDPAPGSNPAGLQTPFLRLRDAGKEIFLFLSFFFLSF